MIVAYRKKQNFWFLLASIFGVIFFAFLLFSLIGGLARYFIDPFEKHIPEKSIAYLQLHIPVFSTAKNQRALGLVTEISQDVLSKEDWNYLLPLIGNDIAVYWVEEFGEIHPIFLLNPTNAENTQNYFEDKQIPFVLLEDLIAVGESLHVYDDFIAKESLEKSLLFYGRAEGQGFLDLNHFSLSALVNYLPTSYWAKTLLTEEKIIPFKVNINNENLLVDFKGSVNDLYLPEIEQNFFGLTAAFPENVLDKSFVIYNVGQHIETVKSLLVSSGIGDATFERFESILKEEGFSKMDNWNLFFLKIEENGESRILYVLENPYWNKEDVSLVEEIIKLDFSLENPLPEIKELQDGSTVRFLEAKPNHYHFSQIGNGQRQLFDKSGKSYAMYYWANDRFFFLSDSPVLLNQVNHIEIDDLKAKSCSGENIVLGKWDFTNLSFTASAKSNRFRVCIF